MKKITYFILALLFISCAETDISGYWIAENGDYNAPDSCYLFNSPCYFSNDSIEVMAGINIFTCADYFFNYTIENDVFKFFKKDSTWKEFLIKNQDSNITLNRIGCDLKYYLKKIEKPKIYKYSKIKRIEISSYRGGMMLPSGYAGCVKYLFDFENDFVSLCGFDHRRDRKDFYLYPDFSQKEQDYINLQFSRIDTSISKSYEPLGSHCPEDITTIKLEDGTILKFETARIQHLPTFLRFFIRNLMNYYDNISCETELKELEECFELESDCY